MKKSTWLWIGAAVAGFFILENMNKKPMGNISKVPGTPGTSPIPPAPPSPIITVTSNSNTSTNTSTNANVPVNTNNPSLTQQNQSNLASYQVNPTGGLLGPSLPTTVTDPLSGISYNGYTQPQGDYQYLWSFNNGTNVYLLITDYNKLVNTYDIDNV